MKRPKALAAYVVVCLALPAAAWSRPLEAGGRAEAVRASAKTYDVVVYGGTSAGVIAAVEAARCGRTVCVIEPGRHLGGLTSGGLGFTDTGRKEGIGGLAREFYRRIKRHYDRDEAWVHERRDAYERYRKDDDAMWTFEPHVAEDVFRGFVKEHGIEVVFGERLDLRRGVEKEGRRLRAVIMESGLRFRGKVFIDATYEGDLMALAGVTFTVGREANAVYGETLNGVQKKRALKHQFVRPVDPYAEAGNPESGLLPGITAGPSGEDGEGDRRVQAYNFRLCLTDVPENRVPFEKPADYDPRLYELLLRNFEAGDHRLPLKIDMMPNRKTDVNNNHAVSTDFIGMNYEYPNGDYAVRERIRRAHENYIRGLMWTLAEHPRVPEAIRREVRRWGWARDEFRDNGNFPHQMYVREARRMVSDYVVTEHDCRGRRRAEDSVGLASYNMDSHNCQRYVDRTGHVRNEGDIQVPPAGPYPIPYRAIRPRREEVENLLVPVCLSASHIAYGSIRMEPVFMILGQSAGAAAVLAVESGTSVQDLPYERLRARLLEGGQILDPPAPRGTPRSRLEGVVIDDEEALFTGAWVPSASVAPYVELGYRHDDNAGKGAKSARFEVRLPKEGNYEVRFAYTPHSNRAANVPVRILHAGGETQVEVDQRRPPPIRGLFVSLGVYRFVPDRPAAVIVSTEGTEGYVVADAVQFLLQGKESSKRP